MLDKLGVDMGSEFVSASYKNPWGTYEELELYKLNRRVFSGEAKPSEYAGYVAQREEQSSAVWGIKDPALCHTLHSLLPYLDDVRIVALTREPEDTIQSFNRVELMGINAAKTWCAELTALFEEQLKNFDGPILELTWEEVKANPADVTKALTTFCYEGLPIRPGPQMKAKAIEHIKPPKKVEGFGSIAIGTRVGHTPEPDFFVSWTAMTTGGARTGDTILAPECYQPAHWAATKLARAFLKSGRDTLLMVDDDMLFPPDALEKMRSKEENWQYDIVSCFATHKTWPPKPIIMRLMDPKDVSEPDRLKGDHFKLVHDFEDGAVEPTDAGGLAFTLIRREVFIPMLHPDYGLDYSWFFEYGPGWESDDIPFSRRCRELGFKMAVDTDTRVGHIGRRTLGYEQFVAWREQEEGSAPGQVDFTGDDLIPILREVANSDNGYAEKAKVMLGMINDATEE
jgi:hypothetical protein